MKLCSIERPGSQLRCHPRFLASAWALLAVVGCTQLQPPMSAKKGTVSSQSDEPAMAGTFLALDDSNPGQIRVSLSGEDAGKVYRLLALSPDSASTKTGRDFSCSKNGERQECTFDIGLPLGNFKVLREEKDLIKAAPEMDQVKESDAYLSISDPSEGPRVRLQILDSYAEKIFNALTVPRTFDLKPDAVNGPGVRKAADQVDCYQRSKAETPDVKTYDCYLFLNTGIGALDSIDPSIMQ